MQGQALHSFRAQITEFVRNGLERSASVAPLAGFWLPESVIHEEQGREKREPVLQVCTYDMIEIRDEGLVTTTSGKAYSLNRSERGMLLLMGCAPTRTQYLEVHTAESFRRRAASVLEVRWTRVARIESEGELYLVGCKRLFGPCPYLQF